MRNQLLVLFAILLPIYGLFACSKSKAPSEEKKISKAGPVKLNSHPSTLEGKTVILRWNGKFNGDNFLNAISHDSRDSMAA